MGERTTDVSLCPRYHHAIELIGRRWSGAILQVMRSGIVRFSDMAAAIPGLSDRMLSERLKELEAEQLIERRVIPETPVRVEYRLTARGEALGSIFDALRSWAHTWVETADADGTGGIGTLAESATHTATAPRGANHRRPRGSHRASDEITGS